MAAVWTLLLVVEKPLKETQLAEGMPTMERDRLNELVKTDAASDVVF